MRGAAAHLRPGGFATVLCNWICRTSAGALGAARARGSRGSTATRSSSRTARSSRSTTRRAGTSRCAADPEAYGRAVGRWLDYYEREGIAAIGIGAVVLRGRDGPGWVQGFAAPRPAAGSAGAHILRLFEATDRLARLRDDAELLDERLGLVRGHRLDQTLVFGDEYEVAGVTMSLAEGVGLVAEIEPEVLPLLFELTPDDDRARRRGRGRASTRSDAVPTVRRLLEHGLLELQSS